MGVDHMNESYALTEAVYYILLSLCSRQHGYGIMQQTERMSGGRVKLAAGTLYGALSTLSDKGWIKGVAGDENSRRKEYEITYAGRMALMAEVDRLRELLNNADKILGTDGSAADSANSITGSAGGNDHE